MAKEYLDKDGLLYFWQKIKNLFATKADAVKNITRSGTTFTATRADGTTFTFTQQDNTVAKTTTTPKMNGTAAVGTETKYAAGDHVHPSDTSRVPTTRTVNGHALSADVTVTANDVPYAENVSVGDKLLSLNDAIPTYGVCSTAAATAAKTVSADGFSLGTGAEICVKFSNTNTAAVSGLTLSVNGSTAKPIKYRGGNLPSAGTLAANRVYKFVYDGTNFELVGDLDTDTHWQIQGPYAGASTGTNSAATDPYIKMYEHNTLLGTMIRLIGGANISVKSDGGGAVTIAAKDLVDESNFDLVYYENGGDPTIYVTYDGGEQGNGVALPKWDGTHWGLVNPSTVSGWLSGYIATSAKGAANGVCPLNASTKIDATYLPSYVDDVIEAYARSGQTALSSTWLATGSASGTVITPETGKIYVLMADSGDYAANTQFRWSGSAYVKLADGGVSSITNAEIDTIVAS